MQPINEKSTRYSPLWLTHIGKRKPPEGGFREAEYCCVLCGGRHRASAAAQLQADATEADDHHRPGAEFGGARRRRREVLLNTDILEILASRRDLRDEIAVEIGVGDAVEVGCEEKRQAVDGDVDAGRAARRRTARAAGREGAADRVSVCVEVL